MSVDEDLEARHREARRAARASWPLRKLDLAREGAPELIRDRPVADLVAMVHALTVDAWALSGRAIPDYSRADMPGRVIRRTP